MSGNKKKFPILNSFDCIIIINLKPLNWAESKEGLNNFFGSAVTNIQNFFITLQKNHGKKNNHTDFKSKKRG